MGRTAQADWLGVLLLIWIVSNAVGLAYCFVTLRRFLTYLRVTAKLTPELREEARLVLHEQIGQELFTVSKYMIGLGLGVFATQLPLPTSPIGTTWRAALSVGFLLTAILSVLRSAWGDLSWRQFERLQRDKDRR